MSPSSRDGGIRLVLYRTAHIIASTLYTPHPPAPVFESLLFTWRPTRAPYFPAHPHVFPPPSPASNHLPSSGKSASTKKNTTGSSPRHIPYQNVPSRRKTSSSVHRSVPRKQRIAVSHPLHGAPSPRALHAHTVEFTGYTALLAVSSCPRAILDQAVASPSFRCWLRRIMKRPMQVGCIVPSVQGTKQCKGVFSRVQGSPSERIWTQ